MKRFLLEFLICPSCLPDEIALRAHRADMDGEDILSGSLHCRQCGAIYPIHEGIARIIPMRNPLAGISAKYEAPSVVSSYLWSHYGDLFGDQEAASAYREWAEFVGANTGFFLDAGCAVGRFTLEMSRKFDFAVGVDLSHAFIETARELLSKGRLEFPLTIEGTLTEEKTIMLRKDWNADKIEFLAADVQALPFRRGLFSALSSLNLIDKIPLPLCHMKEMNRVAKSEDAQFLLSDPFSWSTEITGEENWLGGACKGPFPGYAEENIPSLLQGRNGHIQPPWSLCNHGHIWWKIRNHRNHFEQIRSCYFNAVR